MEDNPADNNEKPPLGKQERSQIQEVGPLDESSSKQPANIGEHALTDVFEDYLLCREPKLSPERYFYASGRLLGFLKDERQLLALRRQRQRNALHALLCYNTDVGPIQSRSLLEISDSEPDICKRHPRSASQVLTTGSRGHTPTRVRSRSSSPTPLSSSSRTTARPSSQHVTPPDASTPCHTQPGVSTIAPLLSFSTHIFSTPFFTPPSTPASSSTSSPILSSLLADSVGAASSVRDQSASPPIPSPSPVWFNPNLNWPAHKRLQNQPTPSPSPPLLSRLHLFDREKDTRTILEKSILRTLGFKPITQPPPPNTLLNTLDQEKKVDDRKLKRLLPDKAIPGTSYFQKPSTNLVKGPPKAPSDDLYPHLVDLSKEYGVPIESVLKAFYLDQCGSHELKTGIYTAEEKVRLEANTGQIPRPQANAGKIPRPLGTAEQMTSQQGIGDQKTIMDEKTDKPKKGGPYKNRPALKNDV